MALPDLSRLSLRDGVRTGGAADGRAVAEDAEGIGADLRLPMVIAVLQSITTLDEACIQLSQWNSTQSDPLRAVNKKVRDTVETALRKDDLGERLAERVMRAEMALEQGEGLPDGFTTWWRLLQDACRELRYYRIMTGTPPLTSQLQYSYLSRCRTIMLTIVRRRGWALYWASPRLKKDKEVVLAAVSTNGSALEYANAELKKDKEVVLTAVSSYSFALEYADAELKKDKEVVLAAVRKNGLALRWAYKDLMKDKEVVLAAVSQDGRALLWASNELDKDREVVLAAVRQNGEALMHASKELKDDKEVVLAAVRQNPTAFLYVSMKLTNDRQVKRAAGQK